jgi:hypothetical protein
MKIGKQGGEISNVEQGMSNVQVVDALWIVRKGERNTRSQQKWPPEAAGQAVVPNYSFFFTIAALPVGFTASRSGLGGSISGRNSKCMVS